MKIGMQTWGSHGDIRPLLALAEGLQAAGHEVSLVICPVDGADYRAVSSASGVKLSILDVLRLTAAQGQQIARSVYDTRNPLRQMGTFLRLLYEPVEAALFESARQLAADNDVVIGHYFTHPLQTAAEQAGVPYVSVLLSHAGIPSAYDHPNSIAALGKTGNRLLWWVTKAALNGVLKRYPNRYRERLGLAPITDVLTQAWIAAPLTLLAVSPSICPAQPDWPEAVRLCGFLDMRNFEPEASPSAALTRFLDAGDAPVYMTFGSWMPKDGEQQRATLALLAEAARMAGCRAIIQSASWAECGFKSDSQVMYVTAAPHAAVFPRCSAVVHHGGAGTTQAATAAGKPSIVVAHLSEQEHWGRELRRLGVADRTLKRRSLSSLDLAGQIALVYNTPAMRARAARAGEAMRQENGVAEAVRLIEQTFAQRTARPQAA